MQKSFKDYVQQTILLIVLFCTAFSSLVYELVWSRELSFIFGSTAIAASGVLSVFMGGLALGSLFAGRIIEARKKPYTFLAILQFAIGITCILTLSEIEGVASLQTYLFKIGAEQSTLWIKTGLFILSSAILIIPTFLIGVAFPCIIQLYHAKHESIGQSVGRCYWVDTLGASLGMLLAAFLIVPKFGFFRTSMMASVLNIFSGFLVLVSMIKTDKPLIKPDAITEPQVKQSASRIGLKVVCFLFFLSGFSALVLEVIWIRHWSLIFGSGLHAFALVVVNFLLGLSIGSLFYEIFLKKVNNQVFLFSLIELCLAACAVIITVMFPYIEGLFLNVYHASDNYFGLMITMGIICFLILLLPTTLMGMTLPTLCAVNVSEYHVGRDFGRLFASNSFGALFGSFCAGFIIIPALGINLSSFLSAFIYGFIAVAFLFCFSPSVRKPVLAFICIIIATAIVFSTLYRPDHLYTGVFYTGTAYEKEDFEAYLKRQEIAKENLRFLKDGVYGQVTVSGPPNAIFLKTNGRIESGTTGDLLSYQSLLGHFPVVILDEPSDILNIGLGGGWTVRAATLHPDIEKVDCVEINPVIVEVNKNVLHSYNDDVMNNPKLNMILNDGRNYINYTQNKYNAVISEPTELSTSGIASLFTLEFYHKVEKVLKEDGIMCQWFPRYEVVEDDYKIALNTMNQVFPYLYEFNLSKITHDAYYESLLIVASFKPLDVNKIFQERRASNPDKPQEYNNYLLNIVGLVERTFVRGHEKLSEYISDVNIVNTDDLPVLEFHASKTRFRKFREDNETQEK